MTAHYKTYQIHICDDIYEHALTLQNALQSLGDKYPCSVTISSSSEELLTFLEAVTTGDKPAPDVIFMDIRLPESDGITLGKKIKELCPHTYLVFVTAYIEYAVKGYEAEAFRYLLKPVTKEALRGLMEDIKADSDKSKKILIKGKKNSALVALSDILYISAEDKYAIVYTKNDHFISDMSLNKYEEQLSEYGFYRIHRKCLVNVFHHRSICGNKVQVSDGTLLPVSKSKIGTYQDYVFTYMRDSLV